MAPERFWAPGPALPPVRRLQGERPTRPSPGAPGKDPGPTQPGGPGERAQPSPTRLSRSSPAPQPGRGQREEPGPAPGAAAGRDRTGREGTGRRHRKRREAAGGQRKRRQLPRRPGGPAGPAQPAVLGALNGLCRVRGPGAVQGQELHSVRAVQGERAGGCAGTGAGLCDPCGLLLTQGVHSMAVIHYRSFNSHSQPPSSSAELLTHPKNIPTVLPSLPPHFNQHLQQVNPVESSAFFISCNN